MTRSGLRFVVMISGEKMEFILKVNLHHPVSGRVQ